MSDHVKYTLDGVSILAVIGTLAGWLPDLAALFSIIWLGIQFYDRFKYGPRVTRDDDAS